MPGWLLAQNRCSVDIGCSCVTLVKMRQPTGFTELNLFKLRSLLVYSVVGKALSPLCSPVSCSAEGGILRVPSGSRILVLRVLLNRCFEPRLEVTIRKS